MPKTISIFGVTGSIGRSTQKVIAHHADLFNVRVVTANSNVDALARAAKDLGAEHAVIADELRYADLRQALSGTDIQCSAGPQALIDAAEIQCDIAMMAIMGFAGLRPLMKMLEQGNQVAIANKEPLVAAGSLVMAAAQKNGVEILPVDSEHNAISQVFEKDNKSAIVRIILTASGGPFRGYTKEQLSSVTPEQALKHPTWDMGAKISIDSATLANKALEIIEAHVLFDIPPEKIEVVVHPESIVHSMVEYADGSILSQMGASDMCTPIANVLGAPQRLATPGQKLDFKTLSSLNFEQPDHEVFPFLKLAYDCIQDGQHKQIAFNAANEVCVDLFLKQKISFLDIISVASHITEQQDSYDLGALDDIEALDQEIRQKTLESI